MRVRNTSRLSDEWLRPLLEFAARGVNDAGLMVSVINTTTSFRGWAFGRGSFTKRRWPDEGDGPVQVYPASVEYLVRLFIPATIPLKAWTNVKRIRKMYPDGLPPFESEADAVVMLAAHEFRHIWQYRNRKSGKGEYDAEKFAFRRLNDYREHTGRPRIDPVKQPNPFALRMAASRQPACEPTAGEWGRTLRD